jgi:predicted ATP-grasp superfamily ATP-dependent carboligase
MFTNKKQLTPVIVLSAHTMGLGVIRSLGQKGIPVYAVSYSKSDMGRSSRFVKKYFISENPEESPEGFINSVIKIGKKLNKPILMPADDATLKIVSQNKVLLSEYFRVACSDWSIIKKIIFKQHTYAIAEKLGVPTPASVILKDESDLKHAAQKTNFPCILKPFESHTFYEMFNKKMVLVKNQYHLEEEFHQLNKTGTKLLLQEYIPGADAAGVNYNSCSIRGEIKQDFLAHKVRMSDDGFGIPTTVVSSEMNKEVVSHSKLLLKELNYTGYSCIEYKYDERDSQYKLMEINGRYNRSVLLSLKCGINFPFLEYQGSVGEKANYKRKYKTGVFWIDEYKDLQCNFKKIISGKLKISSFFKPYLKSNIKAVYYYGDLMPFIKRVIDSILYPINHVLKK